MSDETMTAEIEKRPLSMTVNGKEVGPIDVPVGMPMIDFLHHYLNLTGTHFGCGQGVCHACTVLEVQPDGRLVDTRTCIANAHAFNGKTIITIEGQAKTDAEGNVTELTPIQKAFIEKFSFQCGYCTPVSSRARPHLSIASSMSRSSVPIWRAQLRTPSMIIFAAVRGTCGITKPCAMSPSPRPAV